MSNYVDFGYWTQGYCEGDLSQPDRYVVVGYWTDGYAEYEDIGSAASVNGVATVTAIANQVKTAVASITGNAQLEVTVVNFLFGTASVNGTATFTAVASVDNIKYDSGSILATASVSADATLVHGGRAVIECFADVVANGNFVVNVSAVVNGNATIIAVGSIIGEEWDDVQQSTDTWTPVSADFNVWQTIQPSSDAWLRQ
jgi:hypothetical protein